MGSIRLLLRTIWYFRLQDAAAAAAVAIGAAVLAGALIVGDSVRGSLRAQTDRRLGDIDYIVHTPHLFRASLADRLEQSPGFRTRFRSAEALLATRGSCVLPATGAGAAAVHAYGRRSPASGECIISSELSRVLDAAVGSVLVLRVDPLAHVAGELPLGAERGRLATLRLRVAQVAAAGTHEDAFSLYPTQRPLRNIWVSLADLQRALDTPDAANLLAVSANPGHVGAASALDALLAEAATLEDYGLKLSSAGDVTILEAANLLLPHRIERAVRQAFPAANTVFAYVADALRHTTSGREIPYSMVAGMTFLPGGQVPAGRIVLNQWAADDLDATPGDAVELAYVARGAAGVLETRRRQFILERVVPTSGIGADRSLVPEFKGVTDATRMSAWKPPRDFDFRPERIRDIDREYWQRFRAAPKAFVNLSEARELWGSGYGSATSVRLSGATEPEVREALRKTLRPAAAGMVCHAIREEQLAASSGSSDFAGLFAGLSMFLVAGAALLVALVIRLSLEQRRRQIGVLLAIGFRRGRIRRLFAAEWLLVLVFGSGGGLVCAVGWAWLLLTALKSIWYEAVGTSLLRLSLEPRTLLLGVAAGAAAAGGSIWLALRALAGVNAVSALSGRAGVAQQAAGRWRMRLLAGALMLALAVAVIVAAFVSDRVDNASAFFIAGALLLMDFLNLLYAVLERVGSWRGAAARRLSRLGMAIASASRNPLRSSLTAGLFAVAWFVIAAVGAMSGLSEADVSAGTGGYDWLAELDVPLPYDLASREGRELLGLDADYWQNLEIVSLRASSGQDASCRNLYRPTQPRIVGVSAALAASGRFEFAAAPAKPPNPWALLASPMPDGAIPAVADYETARWLLRVGVGETLTITDETGRGRTLRLAGLLKKSIFQGDLLVSDGHFRDLFPSASGYRLLLLGGAAGGREASHLAQAAESVRGRLVDFGVTVERAGERLAAFNRVADTYISAFRALGTLGMLLGTAGLLAVLARSLIERRCELALLGALGFRKRRIAGLMSLENCLLLALGLFAGIGLALLAVLPEMLQSGRQAAAFGVTAAAACAVLLAAAAAVFALSLALVQRVSAAALRLE